MKKIWITLGVAAALSGCAQEAPPQVISHTTEVHNVNEKTVEVRPPVNVDVHVQRPAAPPARPTVKTVTRVETAAPAPGPVAKPVSLGSPTPTIVASEKPEHDADATPDASAAGDQAGAITETADGLSVSGSNLTKTIEAKGKSVDVSGDGNTLTLNHASVVSVSGSNNTLTVPESKSISLDGSGNRVTYSGNPTITKNGTDNDVAKQ